MTQTQTKLFQSAHITRELAHLAAQFDAVLGRRRRGPDPANIANLGGLGVLVHYRSHILGRAQFALALDDEIRGLDTLGHNDLALCLKAATRAYGRRVERLRKKGGKRNRRVLVA